MQGLKLRGARCLQTTTSSSTTICPVVIGLMPLIAQKFTAVSNLKFPKPRDAATFLSQMPASFVGVISERARSPTWGGAVCRRFAIHVSFLLFGILILSSNNTALPPKNAHKSTLTQTSRRYCKTPKIGIVTKKPVKM